NYDWYGGIMPNSSVLNNTTTYYWNETIMINSSVLNYTATFSSEINSTATSYGTTTIVTSSSALNDAANSYQYLTVTASSSILNNTATLYCYLTITEISSELNYIPYLYWNLILRTSSSEINNTTTTSYWNSTLTTSSTVINNTTASIIFTPTTTTTTPYNPDICNSDLQVALPNGSCVFKELGLDVALDILNTSANATDKGNALILYFSSIENTNTTNILGVDQVDRYLSSLNIDLNITSNSSFIMAKSPHQLADRIILGASFTRGMGGKVIDTQNFNRRISSELSAAATVSNESLSDVQSLNMIIIDNPAAYINIDNSTDKKLVSSIIIANVQRNNISSSAMNISLYFQNVLQPDLDVNDNYICSFYDVNTFKWNDSGCSKAQYNKNLNRYECSCNHLTSFALIWLPKQSLTSYLNSQDIASLVFQSISIVCFLLIIIHAMFRTIQFPLNTFQIYTLLPLISAATTTILFIFYIALSMTVYTQTSSSHQTNCFTSSAVLMFFTYFFLIFMFCVKTSVGYFNYLRFVHLFPQPSHRKLFIMLFISFFISLIWMAFAVGFYSDSSLDIIKLYPYKLCWFTSDVIYYFLSIPACLFLLINIILFIIVGSHIINHVRNATSVHQSYERMKRCVIVLLSSCITQGIGWLFGVFISFVNGESGYILGWFFVIFNGLEGLWSIILYMIIRSQQMDERKHVIAAKRLMKLKRFTAHKYKNSSAIIDETDNDTITRETELYSK
ncbi:unnamed protein product, partial [Adineta steineri]